MFPKKKSSRERSRLGLPSWRNTRSSLTLVFSSLFRPPRYLARVNFTPSTVSALQLVLFPPLLLSHSLSLSLVHHNRVRAKEKLFSFTIFPLKKRSIHRQFSFFVTSRHMNTLYPFLYVMNILIVCIFMCLCRTMSFREIILQFRLKMWKTHLHFHNISILYFAVCFFSSFHCNFPFSYL